MATRGNGLLNSMKFFQFQINKFTEMCKLKRITCPSICFSIFGILCAFSSTNIYQFNKCQAAETNREGARKSEVIVRTIEKSIERGITRPSAILEYGHKPLVLVSNSCRTAVNQDPVLNQAAARMGQSLRETEDQLMRNLLESTASVINCTGGVNGDNPTEITTADCENVSAVLVTSNADYISELIEGENKFGTGPIRDCFVALTSSSLIPNLRLMAGFLHKAQYPKPDSGLTSEYGSVSNIRFLTTSAGSITANASLRGANVFNTFVVGQESYSSIYLDGETAKFIYHPPGWGDDPAELRSTCAWRFAHARVITNDSWLINLRSTL